MTTGSGAAGSLTFRLVLIWLSRTSTQDRGIVTAGGGSTWAFLPGHSVLGEIYPRPRRLDASRYEPGCAVGYRYATRGPPLPAAGHDGFRHHDPSGAGGDYAGGPRPAGDWTLGFNLVRIF